MLVNNVDDRENAARMAGELLAAHTDVTRVEWVAEHLPPALDRTGLRPRDLQRVRRYTDWALVAMTLPGLDHVVHWDADCRLKTECDWVTPVLDRMAVDPRIAVGNPAPPFPGLAEREALQVEGDLAIGYGFSDQVFLARRSQLGTRVYRYMAPASWRGPLSHVAPIFEQRVDAWMRRTGHLRATYLPAVYDHTVPAGGAYPATGLREWLRRAAMTRVAEGFDHPATRAWPDQV